MDVMIRAADPESMLGRVRSEVSAIDRDVPIHQLRTMEEAFKDENSSSAILMGMFISFAVIALVLAASGLYGVISYSVSQRYQEIGIRMALGAVPRDIRTLIARQTVVLVGAGCVFGLAGGAALAQTTSSLLYDVSATDPSTYIIVAVLLSLVAGFSALAPVRRATRVDPLMTLRGE
jgi:putative ABC transport system permease protein